MKEMLDIRLVDEITMRAKVDAAVNPFNSVYFEFNDSQAKATAFCHQDGLSNRTNTIVVYIRLLMNRYMKSIRSTLPITSCTGEILFQGDDRPVDCISASWQTRKDYQNVILVPDFYYTQNNGYTSFLPYDIPDWNSRIPKVFWRGGTTGGWNITLQSLTLLPRYQLCKIGLTLGPKADFAFYNLVQMQSELEREKVEKHLMTLGLLQPWIDLRHYTNYKFFIQIDGNGNSWELVKKLRLGCCMLLVDSPWLLWHNKGLVKWEHFVPVESDLSNLSEMIDWCLLNDSSAKRIAKNGRMYALSLNFEDELVSAANAVFGNLTNRVKES